MEDKQTLEQFLNVFDIETKEGVANILEKGLLHGKNDCCNKDMTLVKKRNKWMWQCGVCRSTKSLLRQSFFEVSTSLVT